MFDAQFGKMRLFCALPISEFMISWFFVIKCSGFGLSIKASTICIKSVLFLVGRHWVIKQTSNEVIDVNFFVEDVTFR